MPLLTIIVRLVPPLILVESMDQDMNELSMGTARKLGKQLIQNLSPSSNPTGIIRSDRHYYLYIIESDVCYMTAYEQNYPKRLAFNFIEEVKNEFVLQHGSEIAHTKRPYAFEAFDTYIQKTKRLYMDTRGQHSLNKVSADLKDINRIMQQSVTDILGRTIKISEVAAKSENLGTQAEAFYKRAKRFNFMYVWNTWAPIAAGAAFIALLFFLRYWLF